MSIKQLITVLVGFSILGSSMMGVNTYAHTADTIIDVPNQPNSNIQRTANAPSCGDDLNPCGEFDLVRSKIKPVFSNSNNDMSKDRLNLVFVYLADSYTNNPIDNLPNLQDLLQIGQVPDLSDASAFGSGNYFYGNRFGFGTVEPLKSNLDKFNFWYYEDKDQFTKPEILDIAKEFRNYSEDLEMPYPVAIPLQSDTGGVQNAYLASTSIDYTGEEMVVKNFRPGSGSNIELPQYPDPVGIPITFVHEMGHAIFGFADEYYRATLPTIDNTAVYNVPNCAINKGHARLLWGDKVGQIDPFAIEVQNMLNENNYSKSMEPDFLDQFTVSLENEGGCRVPDKQEQYIPTEVSIMNCSSCTPIFGAHNRAVVESILNIFSGTDTFLNKPSTETSSISFDFSNNPAHLSAIVFDETKCQKYKITDQTYMDCFFTFEESLKDLVDYRNENNVVKLIYSNPSNLNDVYADSKLCHIGFDNLFCGRMNITNTPEDDGQFYVRINSSYTFANQIGPISILPTIDYNSSSFNGIAPQSEYDFVKETGLLFKPEDFNKDGIDDIMWWNETTGEVHIWVMENSLKSSTTFVLPPLKKTDGYEISALGDFDGDGDGDLLWRKNDGQTFIWMIENGSIVETIDYDNVPFTTSWFVAAVGNFGGIQDDGVELPADDILWRNALTGETHVWVLDNGVKAETGISDKVRIDGGWDIRAICNFSDSRYDQIVWLNRTSREFHIWLMRDGVHEATIVNEDLGVGWDIRNCTDLNNDSFDDVIFQEVNDGRIHVWGYELYSKVSGYDLDQVSPASGWYIEQTGNYNGQGGVMWRNTISGETHIWQFDQTGKKSGTAINDVVSTTTGWKAETIVPVMDR